MYVGVTETQQIFTSTEMAKTERFLLSKAAYTRLERRHRELGNGRSVSHTINGEAKLNFWG